MELKAFGFKPDFWVTIADAITVEGVILDMANHQVRRPPIAHLNTWPINQLLKIIVIANENKLVAFTSNSYAGQLYGFEAQYSSLGRQ